MIGVKNIKSKLEMAWPAAMFATGAVVFGMGLSAAYAPEANAIPPGPNSCVSGGGGFIGGGGYEDCDLWPDGSFYHRVYGFGPFAFGGSSGRVCDGSPIPPATDNDPTTKCPGW